MRRFHVKKNDEVVVIAGADKGKRGRVIADPGKKERVIVEGVHMIKKHMQQEPGQSAGQDRRARGLGPYLQCDEGGDFRRAGRQAHPRQSLTTNRPRRENTKRI